MYGRLSRPGQDIYTHYNHLSPSCQMDHDPLPLPFGPEWRYNKAGKGGKISLLPGKNGKKEGENGL